jgi:signal transduction histidine kinase
LRPRSAAGALVRPTRSRLLVVIVVALIATTLAFLGASVASRVIASKIDASTRDLLENSLPSVRELTRARTAVHQLRVTENALADAPPPRDVSQLDRSWREFDTALTVEKGTPWYQGEQALYEEQVAPSIVDLDDAVKDFERVAGAPRGDPALHRAAERLEGAANRADEAVSNLLDLNHEQAFAAAARILQTRKDFTYATMYMEIGSTVVAFIALVLTIEFARHFAMAMRRNAEREAERAQELDLFAQRVAHDLMSPLGAVSLSLSSVQRQHKDEKTVRTVQRAQRVLDQSRRMVDGIYAFARSGARPTGEATAPLRAAVLDATSAQRDVEGDGGPVIEVQDFEEVEVKMGRAMLDVVLSNLLSNAVKFTATSPVRRITVRALTEEPRRVHVEVEDTGPGVPQEWVDVIFKPYKRAPGVTAPGLGLGLATVKRLVEGYGGAVGVRSAPSGGAVFWFELPRAQQRAPTAEAAARGEGRAQRPGALRPRPSS